MLQRQEGISLDIIRERKEKSGLISFSDFQKTSYFSQKTSAVLFRRGKISTSFFTDDSKRYLTSREMLLQKKGYRIRSKKKLFDGIQIKYQLEKPSWEIRKRRLEADIKKSYDDLKNRLSELGETLSSGAAQEKAWKASLIGSLLVGMVSMSMIYRYLGQNASADYSNFAAKTQSLPANFAVSNSESQVLGAEISKEDEMNVIFEELGNEQEMKKELEQKILKLVEGYPIEKMVPYIMEKDKKVAIFLVSIAKKESDWGKRVPVLNGQDCYNYWGYRGIRKFMGTGGHTCFNSRKDAVDTVAKRLETLIEGDKLDTPKEMIVWKCGSSCDGHSEYSVQKWISDVEKYYRRLNQ